MDLNEVADRLYALAPADFTQARDAAADQARQAGDRNLARQIKALRRPTTAAWMANRLTRSHPEQITAFTDLGRSLRHAQENLAGEQMRDLLVRRRQVVAALVARAREDARTTGQRVGDGPEEELAETLQAALADDQATRDLASRYLTTALHPGHSPALPAAPNTPTHKRSTPATVPEPTPPGKKPPRTAAGAEKLEKLRRDADRLRGEAGAADEAARAAEAQAEDLASHAEGTERAADQAEAAVEDARTALAAAEADLEAAVTTARDASEQAEASARTASQARAKVDELTVRLARLNALIAESTE